MLDPRIDLANMLHELREQLNKVEMKLWEIPHHEEPVEEYEAVFTAPAEGDYLHPYTPTHERPEGFSEEAYWDSCMQAWMEPTPYEWDEYNYCCNADCNTSYDCESNAWVEGNDWSNDYASEWYDMPMEDEVAEMPAHDEVHYENAPVEEFVEAPVIEEHAEHVEEVPVQQPGFDASAPAPAEDPNQT